MEFEIPTGEARDAMLDRAVAADIALTLRLERGRSAAAREVRPTYGDIHRAAALGDAEARARVEEAAKSDFWVARTYREILARDAVAMFGEVRAASTGDVLTREAGAYTIEIRASAKRPERSFLAITLAPGAAVPRRLVVHPEADRPAVEPLGLGEPAEGVIQVVLPSDHPVLAAIRDPERSFHLA
ncbi:hypothetical protein LNKW23_22990 [Paralimibaculum aggregatum]|uniref:Uncharacterized protein n=1 Tax=Paralimibaculum aggregatum TaxID=3036245 RepID=A0ABQ6LIH8_9RHOB|nr:hypothetical protein [Limibaculum sp. NKW23]GMG83086.1 hypothetical protein LNKW23_22990 [Limibaculum sp. NKW23]